MDTINLILILLGIIGINYNTCNNDGTFTCKAINAGVLNS
jgi:hypothetical protein